MCDYSLMHVKSRPAAVGDKLVVTDFGTGTKGFASPDDKSTAVCVLPGTEIAFDKEAPTDPTIMASIVNAVFGEAIPGETAIFRQINKEQPHVHHDVVEFADGSSKLLTTLRVGQKATVLQLPAAPKTEGEAKEQERVAVTA